MKRVLIAGDQMSQFVVVSKDILEARGYVVDIVDDGLKALDCVRWQPYEFVILESNIPIIDGKQSALSILELRPEQKILYMVFGKNQIPELDSKNIAILNKTFIPKREIHQMMAQFLEHVFDVPGAGK